MEPPVAIALYKNSKMEVWAPTQNPDVCLQDLGRVLYNLPWDRDLTDAEFTKTRDTVTLHLPMLGGSFGRKLSPDYILEAGFLALQIPASQFVCSGRETTTSDTAITVPRAANTSRGA